MFVLLLTSSRSLMHHARISIPFSISFLFVAFKHSSHLRIATFTCHSIKHLTLFVWTTCHRTCHDEVRCAIAWTERNADTIGHGWHRLEPRKRIDSHSVNFNSSLRSLLCLMLPVNLIANNIILICITNLMWLGIGNEQDTSSWLMMSIDFSSDGEYTVRVMRCASAVFICTSLQPSLANLWTQKSRLLIFSSARLLMFIIYVQSYVYCCHSCVGY